MTWKAVCEGAGVEAGGWPRGCGGCQGSSWAGRQGLFQVRTQPAPSPCRRVARSCPPPGHLPLSRLPFPRPRRRLPAVATTWLRRRGCSSACSCSGRSGGSRASRSPAPASVSRTSKCVRTKSALVSAGRRGGRRVPGGGGGRAGGSPTARPWLRGSQARGPRAGVLYSAIARVALP